MKFRSPVFSRQDKTAIDMEVEHSEYGWVPFTATPYDPEAYGRQLYVEAVAVAAPFVAPEPSPYSISKTTPWLRMTDAEAATMETALANASPRLRMIYGAAQYLSSDDPFWPTLSDLLTSAFGSVRASELLAPE